MVGVCAAAIAAIGGGATTSDAPRAPAQHRVSQGRLFDRPYVIASLVVREGPNPIRDGSEVEVAFARTRSKRGKVRRSIGWNAHCNSSGAELRITPRRLILHGGAETLIGCDAAAAREDRWLSRFFEADPFWRAGRTGPTLSTHFATMRLRPGTAPPGPP